MNFDLSVFWFYFCVIAAAFTVPAALHLMTKAVAYYAGKVRDQTELKAKRVELLDVEGKLHCAQLSLRMHSQMLREAIALGDQGSAVIARQASKIAELNKDNAAKQARIVELESRLHALLLNTTP